MELSDPKESVSAASAPVVQHSPTAIERQVAALAAAKARKATRAQGSAKPQHSPPARSTPSLGTVLGYGLLLLALAMIAAAALHPDVQRRLQRGADTLGDYFLMPGDAYQSPARAPEQPEPVRPSALTTPALPAADAVVDAPQSVL